MQQLPRDAEKADDGDGEQDVPAYGATLFRRLDDLRDGSNFWKAFGWRRGRQSGSSFVVKTLLHGSMQMKCRVVPEGYARDDFAATAEMTAATDSLGVRVSVSTQRWARRR